MDSAALDAGGIKLAQTTFRIDPALQEGTWCSQPCGGPAEGRKVFMHATDPLNPQHADAERDRVLPPGVTELLITAAPDLRRQLVDVIQGIEAEERVQADQRRREQAEDEDEDPPARLSFSGRVVLSDEGDNPWIDGRSVLKEVDQVFGRGEQLVEVYLGIEREPAINIAGPVQSDEGWAGTAETPGDWPQIEVGDFDLLKQLRDHEGKHVELVVRQVARPGPFRIEVEPELPEGKWVTPDIRFSAQPRPASTLDGAKLVELLATTDSIQVSFSMHSTVKRAIADYKAIEREAGKIYAEIEVVAAGKVEGVSPADASRAAYRLISSRLNLAGPEPSSMHFGGPIPVAFDFSPKFGFGLFRTLDEKAAAERAVEAHREGKLVIGLNWATADKLLVGGHGKAKRLNLSIPGNLRGPAAELAAALDEAREFAAAPDEGDVPDLTVLYQSDDLAVFVDHNYTDGQWQLGEGLSPGSKRTGNFTSKELAEAMGEGYKKLTVSEFLRPNAEAFLAGMGIGFARHEMGGKR